MKVCERVRETHTSLVHFELEACFHPNRDAMKTSRTYIMSHDATRANIKSAFHILAVDSSCTALSEVKLKYWTASELISDLWLVNKTTADRKTKRFTASRKIER
jgi:hypothetical protein